jgi:hypothetical protein
MLMKQVKGSIDGGLSSTLALQAALEVLMLMKQVRL